MFYTIYKTTNQINGKIYIGYHSTLDLNDSYLGSGKILNQAIEKNGTESFTKEILYVFPSKEEALQKEREIVNEEFIQRDDTYNMKIGGEGGWDHTHRDPEIIAKRQNGNKRAIKNGSAATWKLTKEQRSNLTTGKNNGFYGKKHTEESKRKIGESKKLDQKVIEERIKDWKDDPKDYGYKTRLAKKWGVSHTQVRRFETDHKLNI